MHLYIYISQEKKPFPFRSILLLTCELTSLFDSCNLSKILSFTRAGHVIKTSNHQHRAPHLSCRAGSEPPQSSRTASTVFGQRDATGAGRTVGSVSESWEARRTKTRCWGREASFNRQTHRQTDGERRGRQPLASELACFSIHQANLQRNIKMT